ncbi:TIGR03503 family protein [Alteromonas sp. BL110]|uniref:TIGR03503 family protein n=1 Tax=Alteromonas sp. BL110 TaxID=1714845 RepID=UPI000E4DB0A3|nr:TIGR03503 family protein [Alteromonas sp. BL110]AXT40658.1 TIGR03503 family protein [Alteromonas sp. BL110]RKM79894.1 TIGR03503 family protein [Alteromonas sp. BL110]
MRVWFYWGIILSLFIHLSTGAQSQEDERDAARQLADSAIQSPQSKNQDIDTSPLTDLGDSYTNSIKLLQNRFRVDYNVEEITMVFFREYGSAPVVLVRPDGSKLFQGRVDEEKVEWFDADTFDMITIKNPVPGPWQAVGQVLPESRVMVISNIELHADPLPDVLFAGEILKSTAYLTNNGKPIDNKQFRDVVELDIEFKSTNNPNFGNFGTGDQNIATFQDDGRGMDERPGDGIFTGQFNLKIAAGEWKPVFRVSTPMYTREQESQPIVLHNNPVSIDVEMNGGGDGYHKIIIDVDRELVDIESLLVDGKIKFPNADMQNFSLTEGGSEPREHLIVAYEEGIFRVKITAYGTTMNGRDFILDVPEFSFVAEGPPEPEVEDPLIDGKDPIVDGSAPLVATPELNPAAMTQDEESSLNGQEEMDNGTLTLILIAVNGSIVLIGVIAAAVIIFMRKKRTSPKSSPSPTKQPSATTDADLSMEEKPKGLKKLFGMFKKGSKPEKS